MGNPHFFLQVGAMHGVETTTYSATPLSAILSESRIQYISPYPL